MTKKKYRKLPRSPLRGLLSEVLPYELPLPFDNRSLYKFLRTLRFEWTTANAFRVKSNRLQAGDLLQLRELFSSGLGPSRSEDGWTHFTVSKMPFSQHHPYKYVIQRNDGRPRYLAVPHPQSMVELTRFIDDYADSILYYCTRSPFSVRHPAKVARIAIRKDKMFDRKADHEEVLVEQYDLEYEYSRSYFTYEQFNGIHRLYNSAQFRACERKYPYLWRLDVSKCFDSIYTHTVSWVTNGIRPSKTGSATKGTFGDSFDKLFQNTNYRETSGILIGPEASRIFAEVILQEVDVLTSRDLEDSQKQLRAGIDYEIMRYVDDYFVFVTKQEYGDLIQDVLSKNLALYKLHINDQKTFGYETPLSSEMSVAKHRINKNLDRLMTYETAREVSAPSAKFFFPVDTAILEYKSTLLDTSLEHGELANWYLYRIFDHVRRACKKYAAFDQWLTEQSDSNGLKTKTRVNMAQFLIACIDTALFAYSGAPSTSHSMKLTQIVTLAYDTLKQSGFTRLEMSTFRDKIRRELMAQLRTAREEKSFGIHTQNLIDCLTYIDFGLSDQEIKEILESRGITFDNLDGLSVLVLLRSCGDRSDSVWARSNLLAQAKCLVEKGCTDPEHETERTILRLSIPHCSWLEVQEVRTATGYTQAQIRDLRSSAACTFFDWKIDDAYYRRLSLKSSQVVY
ncbi:RNA-directed DNA polymerase [Actinomycetaceae bacterium WB03_NA08]|uniref:RNA-directed DNA polymerase n=1 Tax=Scrofimicrobium canadense TaxID=2652290 RepID=A0A6N7VSR1_9ACTO|nr:antiviral reverse transcriptase Drt3b [Scrofimicrobium canadense]MSS84819.1 RNA-directed DNA polymerase [Scrofimicrobium canadense]